MSECYYCGGSFGNCTCSEDRHRDYLINEKQKKQKEEKKRDSIMLEKAKPFIGKFFFYKKKDCFNNFKVWFHIADVCIFSGNTKHHVGFKINKMIYCEGGNTYYFMNRLGYETKKEKSNCCGISAVYYLDEHIVSPVFEEITEKEFNEVLKRYNEFNTYFNI